MISKIANSVTKNLLESNVIAADDYEIYEFGLEQMISSVFNIISIMFIGIMFNEIFPCIVFMISFMTIRSYAGGYHASTRTRCYWLSIFAAITVLSIIKYVNIGTGTYIILFIISSIIILIASPVGTKNNCATGGERIAYRRKTIAIWLVESIVLSIGFLLGAKELIESIVLAMVVLGVSQCAEIIGRTMVSS